MIQIPIGYMAPISVSSLRQDSAGVTVGTINSVTVSDATKADVITRTEGDPAVTTIYISPKPSTDSIGDNYQVRVNVDLTKNAVTTATNLYGTFSIPHNTTSTANLIFGDVVTRQEST